MGIAWEQDTLGQLAGRVEVGRGLGHRARVWVWETAALPMASRKSPAQRLPDAVREAVESTVQATRESAQGTRGRAQEAVDDLVKAAEAGAEAVRERVRDAGEGAEAVRDQVRGTLEKRRPATSDDIREIKTELRAIARRLDAIEDRLPAKRAAAKPRGSAKARSGSGGSAKRGSGRSQS